LDAEEETSMSALMCPSHGPNPYDQGHDPTELEDAILGLLEDAGMDTTRCDAVMAIIDDWYRNRAATGEPA
jgi:hypothetical protein